MQNKNKKSLLGAYNLAIDESAHVLLSLIVALIGFSAGLSFWQSFIVFISGAFLIDVDHFLNTHICKNLIKVSNYKGDHVHCDQGYVPHVLHGFDVAIILSIIVGALSTALLGWMLFLALALHVLWDFAVYPFHHSHLMLAHRARKGFRPGTRDYFLGRIFDIETLKW